MITAEESWETVAGGSTSPYGRLFELKNPIDAPAIFDPLTPTSNDNADFVHQNVIPRTSHEGIQFDKAGNMYFIDELNGGNLYKYTSAATFGPSRPGRPTTSPPARPSSCESATATRRTPPARTPGFRSRTRMGRAARGTDHYGRRGVTSVDARNTTNLAPFKGTDYQRPEDMQIQKFRGRNTSI